MRFLMLMLVVSLVLFTAPVTHADNAATEDLMVEDVGWFTQVWTGLVNWLEAWASSLPADAAKATESDSTETGAGLDPNGDPEPAEMGPGLEPNG